LGKPRKTPITFTITFKLHSTLASLRVEEPSFRTGETSDCSWITNWESLCKEYHDMPLPYVMPTAPLFYSITMKTEYEPKKVLLTVDVTALVTKEDSPGRSALLGLSLPLQHL